MFQKATSILGKCKRVLCMLAKTSSYLTHMYNLGQCLLERVILANPLLFIVYWPSFLEA